MKTEKIIYETKPKIISLYGVLFLFLIGTYFVYTSESLTIKIFMGGIFLFALIFGMIRNYLANGIIITENKIELLKTNMTGKTESEFIDFSEIKSVKYNQGQYRQDSAIYLRRKLKSELKVLIPINSFEFGHVLKFLNGKGIEINLVHSDQELRMFIDGKITEFPMTNEKTA
tara:strand:- start:48 stop:563 length:516 start_codon:yes stop_codon:yes gene_type:complete